jgi:selenocysteine-specific elongation factor
MVDKRVLNVNVGILGHIDSGKTSLARALSTHFSTASLDKHPQSTERGITLDLGFSSFTAPVPENLAHLPYDEIQFTLVDCPGHASLIKTVLGGAQIIDVMMLVVDVNKGIQTQTAECLVVGEITTSELLVVLNKTDMIPEAGRGEKIAKMTARLGNTFKATKFKECVMVPIAARPGGAVDMSAGGAPATGVTNLVNELMKRVEAAHCRRLAKKKGKEEFLFAVDHCFPIKGQGTVLTGTVLSGRIAVGDTVELPTLKLEKKIKSMQVHGVVFLKSRRLCSNTRLTLYFLYLRCSSAPCSFASAATGLGCAWRSWTTT